MCPLKQKYCKLRHYETINTKPAHKAIIYVSPLLCLLVLVAKRSKKPCQTQSKKFHVKHKIKFGK